MASLSRAPRPSSYRVLHQITYGYRYGRIYPRFMQQHRSCLRYGFSTSVPTSAPAGVPIEPILHPAAPPTPPRSRSMRYVRTMITVGIFFMIGTLGGRLIGGILVPPPLPILDSEEDAALLAKLKKDLASLELVEVLRSPECKDSGWVEYEAFMDLPEEVRDQNMSAGALRGTRGIAFRRMWWNAKKRRLQGFVFLGGALTGWPGVVHGGIVATILMECIATVGKGGPQEIRGPMSMVAGQDVEDEMVRELEIHYLKPTNANGLFLVAAEYKRQEDDTVICGIKDVLTDAFTAVAWGKVGRERIRDQSSSNIF